MATELQLEQGLQTLLQAMSIFDNADVVINDDSVHDAPGAAYNRVAIIATAEDVDLAPAPGRLVGTITIPLVLVEPFVTNRKDTYDNFRAMRQAVWDEVFTGSGMSLGGLAGVMVRGIRTLGPFVEWGSEQTDGTIFPVYLEQGLGVEVELF